jgi:hypothetical protein
MSFTHPVGLFGAFSSCSSEAVLRDAFILFVLSVVHARFYQRAVNQLARPASQDGCLPGAGSF